MPTTPIDSNDPVRLGRLILCVVLAIGLLITGGVLWLINAVQGAALRQVDTYLVHSAPLHLGGNLSLSRTEGSLTRQVWASCGNSGQPITLRDPGRFRLAGPQALADAARNIERLAGTPVEDGGSWQDLAWALRQWPQEQIHLDRERGVLVASRADGRVVCLLITRIEPNS